MIEQISVTELKALMDAGDVRLVDVREKFEYDAGHVAGSEWIPMSLVPLRKDELTTGDPVYLICRTGNRSGQVAIWLHQQGIRSINVDGGIVAWQQLGFPTAQPSNERISR